jgi:hypothetical protein
MSSNKLAGLLLAILNVEEHDTAEQIIALTECLARVLLQFDDHITARSIAGDVSERLIARIDVKRPPWWGSEL